MSNKIEYHKLIQPDGTCEACIDIPRLRVISTGELFDAGFLVRETVKHLEAIIQDIRNNAAHNLLNIEVHYETI